MTTLALNVRILVAEVAMDISFITVWRRLILDIRRQRLVALDDLLRIDRRTGRVGGHIAIFDVLLALLLQAVATVVNQIGIPFGEALILLGRLLADRLLGKGAAGRQ